MKRRSLGKSGRTVTPFGLGMAALGRPGYINLGHGKDLGDSRDIDSMRNRAHEVLDAAWSAGIRYFDTARSYGRAEEFLSSWIASKESPTDRFTIGSKWGYTYTADWQVALPDGERHEVKDHSLPVLNRQMEESRSLFGDQLDLYQIHSATEESGVLTDDRVLSRLAEFRASGLLIGFSVSGPNQADTIRRGLEIERNGAPVFDVVQATWNLLEQSAGAALADAHSIGRGVIVKEALANGRLTSRNQSVAFHERHHRLLQYAIHNDLSIDAIAIGCVLRQPWVSVVLSGAATVEHLMSNLRGVELSEDARLDQFLDSPESAEEYWQRRGRLAWN